MTAKFRLRWGGAHLGEIRNPLKIKFSPQSSAYFLCCLLPTVHFPSPYRLHLQKSYFATSLPLPEGRAGIVRQPLNQ